MSCEFIEADEPCDGQIEWLIEGRTSAAQWRHSLGRWVTHERRVCGDPEHVFQTIAEFATQGVVPISVIWIPDSVDISTTMPYN